MTELENLERTLRRLSGDVAEMQEPVDRTHTAVKGTKSVLAKPRQLSLAMKWLSSKARSLRYTALFLMPFPIIGTLASRTEKVLRTAEGTEQGTDTGELGIGRSELGHQQDRRSHRQRDPECGGTQESREQARA